MKNFLLTTLALLFMAATNYSFSIGGGDWVDPPAGMPDCVGQDAPGNTTCVATPICNLNGYCGTTASSYSADYWSQLNSAFCGSIENNAFLTFTANATNIAFDAYVYNCNDDEAIQIMIFKAADCGSGPVQNLVCVDEMYAQNNAYNVTASGLIPGEDYYIMIDGFAGDVCDYTFVASDGIATPIDAEGIGIQIEDDNFNICVGESVTVEAEGGLGSYTWSGDTGLNATSGDVVTITPPVTPGVYTYTITSEGEIGLCPGSTEYEFTITVDNCCNPPEIFVNDLNMCAGETVDVMDAIDPASDPNANPIIYSSLADGNNATNPLANTEVSSTGTYWIRVDDPIDDCYLLHEVNVNVTTLSFTSVTEEETCGDANGSITLTASGSTTDYTYSIDNGTNFQSEAEFENLTSGAYNVTIADANGCTTEGIVVVGSIGTPELIAPDDVNICLGESTTLTAGNPDGATISWDNGVVDGEAFTPDQVGTTTYTVTAANDECSITAQVNVTVHGSPEVDFEADNTSGCAPHAVVFTNNTTNSSECKWDFGDGNTSTDCGPVSHTYGAAGEYDVTLSITSIYGCEGTDTKTDYIQVVNAPVSAFTADPTTLLLPLTEVEFTNESTNANSYFWDFGDNTSSTDENPIHDFPIHEPGTYLVTLIASNDECSDSESITIIVEYPNAIYEVPNVFSPNNDGQNDVFKLIDPANIKEFTVVILNRWGNVVFEDNDYQFEWNGNVKNGNTQCSEGVYFYKMDFKDHSGKEYKEHGYVHLTGR